MIECMKELLMVKVGWRCCGKGQVRENGKRACIEVLLMVEVGWRCCKKGQVRENEEAYEGATNAEGGSEGRL